MRHGIIDAFATMLCCRCCRELLMPLRAVADAAAGIVTPIGCRHAAFASDDAIISLPEAARYAAAAAADARRRLPARLSAAYLRRYDAKF